MRFAKTIQRAYAPLRRRAVMMTEREYRDLQRRADDICRLILCSDLPEVDIAIERNKLRCEVEDNFPDQLRLYDMI